MKKPISKKNAAKNFKHSANSVNSKNFPKVLKRGGIRL